MGQDSSTIKEYENVKSLTEENFRNGLTLLEELARHNPQITSNLVPPEFVKKTPACLPLFLNLKSLNMSFNSVSKNISVLKIVKLMMFMEIIVIFNLVLRKILPIIGNAFLIYLTFLILLLLQPLLCLFLNLVKFMVLENVIILYLSILPLQNY